MKCLLLLPLVIPLLDGCSDETYTQAGMCGGRPPGWRSPSSGIGELAGFLSIRVTRENAIRWNGKTVTAETMSNYLRELPTLNPEPQTSLIVETGADCRTVRNVRAQMEAALSCRSWGGCGEGLGWRRYPGARIEDR